MTRRPDPERARSALAIAALALLAPACGGGAGEERETAPPAATPPPGAWERAPERRADFAARGRALESIGYASRGDGRAHADSGVLALDPGLASPAPRLYCSGHAPEAFLIDRTGEVLHAWSFRAAEAFPVVGDRMRFFRRLHLMSDGTLLGIFEGTGMVALDADSELLWSVEAPIHHDARELPGGGISTLDRRAILRPAFHPDRPLLDDGLLFLSRAGDVVGRISLVDALLRSNYGDEVRGLIRDSIEEGLARETEIIREQIAAGADEGEVRELLDLIGDLLHCNSVSRVGAAEAAASELFEEGWFLVSSRRLSALFALEVSDDRSRAEVRWFLRGDWRRQHEATLLETGRVLLFDNMGDGEDRARAIEVDPATGEILWQWPRADDEPISSPVAGTARRLDGGNTLVVESTAGRAFEVRPDGGVAWAFASPHRAGEGGEFVALLPQLEVVDPSTVDALLGDD